MQIAAGAVGEFEIFFFVLGYQGCAFVAEGDTGEPMAGHQVEAAVPDGEADVGAIPLIAGHGHIVVALGAGIAVVIRCILQLAKAVEGLREKEETAHGEDGEGAGPQKAPAVAALPGEAAAI